jgi:antibiotic biosynthesis monooxygenase (ABM) superfamily enzyme
LEAWFDLPPGLPPPSRHRMAIPSWLGIWPLVSLVFWLVPPYLSTLPFLVRTPLTTALVVLAMAYVVMPGLRALQHPGRTKRTLT